MLLNAVYLVAFVALLPWVAWRKLSGGRPVAAPWARFTGGIAPLPRCDAGVFVTEHGVADLRGVPLAERPATMIAIAHPAFREALEREAHGARNG